MIKPFGSIQNVPLVIQPAATLHAAKGDYDPALADYDQAIALDPKLAMAYFSRGLVTIYAGSLSKALIDFRRSSELDPKYPYTAIWLDIVNKRSHLVSVLKQAIPQIDMTKWPAPIIRAYMGQLAPAALLKAADDPRARIKKEQLCEANFYSGELAVQQEMRAEAARLFRLAVADCPKHFVEWRAARAELKALGENP
jgi:lipoprotein NlpI